MQDRSGADQLDKGSGVERRDPEQAAALMLRAIDLGDQFSYREMTKKSRRWSTDFRRALQRKPRDAGFYAGATDGSFRRSTLSALNAYVNRRK